MAFHRAVCFEDDPVVAVKVPVLGVRPPVYWSRDRMNNTGTGFL